MHHGINSKNGKNIYGYKVHLLAVLSTTMDKNNEKSDKFYRKVAFPMYTEMVNFRPQR